MNPNEDESPTYDRSNPEAWVEREPASQATTPQPQVSSDDYAPVQSPPPAASTPQLPLAAAPKKSHRAALLTLLIVGVVLVVGVVGAAIYISSQSHPVEKAPEPAPAVVQKPALRVYKNQKNSAEIRTDDATVATIEMPNKKSSFELIAASDQAALLLASSSSRDKKPTGYLVTADGKSSLLPASIAASVARSSTKAHANGYFDRNNNFLTVACVDTSCVLNSTDLKSGEITPVFTQDYTQPAKATSSTTSLSLLGVAADNTAYLVTYSGNNHGDAVGSLMALDLESVATKKSLIMPKAAVAPAFFSPDFTHALFTQSQDGATGNLITWENGETVKVAGTIGNGPNYLWSSDSTRALALGSPHGQPSTLLLIPTDSPSQTALKTFPTSGNVSLEILGWINDTTIQYALTAAGKTTIHAYTVDSGDDKVLKASDGILIPVRGTSLRSS